MNLYVVATGTNLDYAWTGAGVISYANTSNAQITAVSSGNYHIVVSNACGTDEADVALVVNTPPTLNAVITHVSCPGQSDGAIDLSVIGGGTPITYDWTITGSCATNGDCPAGFPTCQFGACHATGIEDLSNLPMGTYTIAVDAGGCYATQQFVVGTASPDSDNDGTADCLDACPLALPGLSNFNTGTCTCDAGYTQVTTQIGPNTVITGCQLNSICTGNRMVVMINTDLSPAQVTWEITDAGNAVIASGAPGTANQLVTDTVCLGTTAAPACYGFRLMDSFGDGISGGSWQLRSLSGRVLLGDDFANGSDSPSLTPAYAGYTEHSFCLPLGNSHTAAKSCGRFNFIMNSKVYCNNAPGATSYQFEFSDPDAGFIRRIAVPSNSVRFSQMQTSPLTPGVKYFARVRNNGSGAMASAHFGGGCELGMNLPATVPCTELISAPTYGHSCNETRAFNTNNSFIYALPVTGATEYQFRVYNTNEGYDETFIRSTYILQLKWNIGVAPPLANGSTYNVTVNVKVGTLYSGFCGNVCTITINNPARPDPSMTQTAGTATMWPNPLHDGQVNLSIDGIRDADQQITVNVQDVYGKQVFTKEFGNSGERFTTILDLPSNIASGVYMVNITVNGQKTVQRLSIIR